MAFDARSLAEGGRIDQAEDVCQQVNRTFQGFGDEYLFRHDQPILAYTISDGLVEYLRIYRFVEKAKDIAFVDGIDRYVEIGITCQHDTHGYWALSGEPC